MTRKSASGPTAKVIAVANYKGGVGKSTIAMHLAAHYQAVLLDLDVNGDATRFGQSCGLEVHHVHRHNQEQLLDLVQEKQAEGKWIVLDCPPGESPLTLVALLMADCVLVPTRPGPLDVVALGRVIEQVESARSSRRRKIPLFFLCNFYRNTDMARVFCEALRGMKAGVFIGKMWERVEYAKAIAAGAPIWAHAPKSTGAEEMRNLVYFIESQVNHE